MSRGRCGHGRRSALRGGSSGLGLRNLGEDIGATSSGDGDDLDLMRG